MQVSASSVRFTSVGPEDVYRTHLPMVGEFEHPLDPTRWIWHRIYLIGME